jgi:hypothetical protein
MSIRIACLAAALACAAAAHAASVMSKDEIKAQQVRIEEQYDHAQARCRRLQGHARELCNEEARAERDIEVAQLAFQANPTPENDQKLRLAKAEAAYATSLVKCKSMDGQARKVCRTDAKLVFEEAKTEAKLQKEVAELSLRSENTVRERTATADRIAESQFNAARERCEMLPGEGRANCLADAKKRFGRL